MEDTDNNTPAFSDKPLPKVDIPALLAATTAAPVLSFNPSFKPISTDVLSIHGRGATPVTTQPHVFYDSELRAIVYRSKDMSSGLASTTIWIWRGKAAKLGDDEKWKIRDLESRFGTKVISCDQGFEPLDLISLLGGVIAIRQGTSTHWSSENTAMHCVRSTAHGSSVIINEIDLVRPDVLILIEEVVLIVLFTACSKLVLGIFLRYLCLGRCICLAWQRFTAKRSLSCCLVCISSQQRYRPCFRVQ